MTRRINIFIGVWALTITTLLATPATAQHYVGAKLGYGAASGRFYPLRETGMFFGNYTGGLAWKYYSEQQIVGGVGAELEFQQRGYKIFYGNKSATTDYTLRRVNSITMPLIWQPHLYFFDRRLRVFLNAAFTVTYNLGVDDSVTEVTFRDDGSSKMVSSSVTTPYKFITARDNRWNYGIFGGFGFGVLFGRCEVFAEARYYYGMSDIIRNYTKYQFQSEFLRSELDNLYINVGFFFRLGKGGIKAPPLKMNTRNRDRKNQNTFDFRNAKPNF
jgi:hypothetical protein